MRLKESGEEDYAADHSGKYHIVCGGRHAFFRMLQRLTPGKSTDTRLQKRNLCLSSLVFGILFGVGNFVYWLIFRNVLLNERLNSTRNWMIGLSILITAGGVLVNTKGIVGLFPVLATLIWTIANYYFRDVFYVKIFLFNQYRSLDHLLFLLIWDFSFREIAPGGDGG